MTRATTRWLLRGLAVLLTCAVLMLLAALFLFGTETGSGWLLQRLAAQAPGQVEIDTWHGTFWRGLNIPSLQYRDATQEIQAKDIGVRINWAALSGGRLQFSSLDAASVRRTDLGPDGAAPQPLALSFKPLMLPIGIRRSRLGRLTLISGDKQRELSDIDLRRALLAGRHLRLARLSIHTPGFVLELKRLRARLSGKVPLSFEFKWNSTDGAWRGQAKAGGSLAKLKLDHHLKQPYRVDATGSVALLGRARPVFDVALSWKKLPLGRFSLDDGTLRLNGTSDEYAAALKSAAAVPGLGTAQVSANAIGDAASLRRIEARLVSPLGNADLQGSASWGGAFALNADIQLHDIDAARLNDSLAGNLEATAKLSLTGMDRATLTVVSVSGRLNSADVGASGELTIIGGSLRCRRCNITLGANRISLDGEAGAAAVGLDFTVDAPDLGSLWPGLAGSIEGGGHLYGAPRNPSFRGALNARHFSYAGLQADRMDLVSRGASADDRDIDLKITGLTRNGSVLGDFDLHANGSLDEAAIEGNWSRGKLNGSFAGAVERSGPQVRGSVKRARIHDPFSGDWSLQAPFGFRLSRGSFESEPQRWSGTTGSLDIDQFSITDRQVRLLLHLAGLPLQVFNPFLPPAYRLRGTANADIDVTRESGRWSGSAHWRQNGTNVAVTPANGEAVEIRVPRAEADLSFGDGGATANLALAIEPGVSAEANLRLQQLSPHSAVRGELHLSGAEWAWVPAVLPFVDQFEGRLDAKLTMAGTLPAPSVDGRLDWRGGHLFVPALNTAFDHIDLELAGAPGGAIGVKGTLDAGDGKLAVSGRIEEPLRPERSVELALSGHDARLADWPEYRIWANPDLKIHGDAAGWRLSGSMDIPRADISVRELPAQATRPSDDVVVLGQAPKPEQRQPYSGEIDLSFGDRVKVRAFGFDSGVTGKLRLGIPASGPLTANGQLKLVDGHFKALGQKLTIAQGTLTFTGPLDDPIVSVRAERVIEAASGTVKAGLQLSGRAQNLSSSVYSEPAMSEADALSYLTLGRPLNQATNKEGNEMANAAVALGLGQAGRITNQIGHKLGLDELGVGDSNDSTALIAGKQLSRKLYARYTYGVFSRIGTLLLQYKLGQHLTLEAGAGEIQTFDLLYTIEKK